MGARVGQLAGPKNPNWKGGRIVDPRGYVLVKQPGHPHADCRGYVYEHVLVAEEKLGRLLLPGEQVHHYNEKKGDNTPENLVVCASRAEHRALHRKQGSRRRLPGEENPVMACACGCGERLSKYDSGGRPRLYISGHNPQASPTVDAISALLANGPVSRDTMSEKIGRPVGSIATALCKMRHQGKAEPIRRGVWKLKGELDGR